MEEGDHAGLDENNRDGDGDIELDVLEEIIGPNSTHEVLLEEQERWIDENMALSSDLGNQNEVLNRTYPAPSDLVVPLIRYQQEWLAWALEKEDSATKGGILADEMGMGKTIQAIALVLAKRDLFRNISEPCVPPASSSNIPEINCTLVICPVVGVSQWVDEIDRLTAKGSTKVLVYHGVDREKISSLFSDYDFVITTYSTVEYEYRKNVMPPKLKCQHCGKLFYSGKMFLHTCRPGTITSEKQSKRARKGEKNTLKVARLGEESNVVKEEVQVEKITVLEQEQCERKSVLHSVKWQRIILDEAHFIKEKRSNTARSVLALESSYKWALSGTPLQNRIGELYALVLFLRVFPYSYCFCRSCNCRILDTSSATDCANCSHKCLHFCWWNKYVATPIQLGAQHVEGERAMFLLRNKILKNIVLRRTKRGRASDLALPLTVISMRRDVMDVQEEDYYRSVYNASQAQFNTL